MTVVARRAALLLVALATTACALTNTGNPNVAAIVGGTEIPVSAVERNVTSISESGAFQQQAQQDPTGEAVTNLRRELVTAMVRSEILRVVAERNDVAVAQADVDAAVEQVIEQAGGEEEYRRLLNDRGLREDFFLQQMRDQEVQRALQEVVGEDGDFVGFLQEELRDVEIVVNPRFGEWSNETLQVEPTDPLTPEDGDQPAGQATAPADGASPPPQR